LSDIIQEYMQIATAISTTLDKNELPATIDEEYPAEHSNSFGDF